MILSFYFLILCALEIIYKHSSIYFFRHFYACEGANYLFPEDWASYEAAIPVEERGDYLLAYGRRLRGELGAEGSIFVSESVSGNLSGYWWFQFVYFLFILFSSLISSSYFSVFLLLFLFMNAVVDEIQLFVMSPHFYYFPLFFPLSLSISSFLSLFLSLLSSIFFPLSLSISSFLYLLSSPSLLWPLLSLFTYLFSLFILYLLEVKKAAVAWSVWEGRTSNLIQVPYVRSHSWLYVLWAESVQYFIL